MNIGTSLTYELDDMSVPCSFKTLMNNAISFSFTKIPEKGWKDASLTAQVRHFTLLCHNNYTEY